jgi:hypothetical protein
MGASDPLVALAALGATELVGEEDRGSAILMPRRHHGSRRGALEEECREDGEERRTRGGVGGWRGEAHSRRSTRRMGRKTLSVMDEDKGANRERQKPGLHTGRDLDGHRV